MTQKKFTDVLVRQALPFPKELLDRIEVLRNKADENKEKERLLTILQDNNERQEISLVDLYNQESSEYFDKIEEEYRHYIWEEQDYRENKWLYEYGLEHLEELSKREKM